jgi:hypothetical protein
VRNAKIYSKDEHFMEQAMLAFAKSRAQGQNPGKRKNEDDNVGTGRDLPQQKKLTLERSGAERTGIQTYIAHILFFNIWNSGNKYQICSRYFEQTNKESSWLV